MTSEKKREGVLIDSPAALRGLLVEAMVGVLEGRVSVPQANAVAGLGVEVHKSIRQEWDMREYVLKNLSLREGRVLLKVIDGDDDLGN